ncbi:MAG: TlpA family protein disulfide reductase [Xanthomonadales bacterium]|nr:TlpA family protein disulfide reductase [Xanthomonadales bacterium]
MKTTKLKIAYYVILASILVSMSLGATEPEKTAPAEGTWTIVNYWSEWCAPCRKEIPMFNKLNQQLAASNVTIVGVNFDEDSRDETLKIAKKMGVDFPTLTMEEVKLLNLKAPTVLPTTYILSPENEVVAKLLGEQSAEDMLKQLALLNLPVKTNQVSTKQTGN